MIVTQKWLVTISHLSFFVVGYMLCTRPRYQPKIRAYMWFKLKRHSNDDLS